MRVSTVSNTKLMDRQSASVEVFTVRPEMRISADMSSAINC
jgi:hypothetical protein